MSETNKMLYNSALPVRPVEATYLSDLIMLFCWLDVEHQSRAVSALNAIVQDQVAEAKATSKAI